MTMDNIREPKNIISRGVGAFYARIYLSLVVILVAGASRKINPPLVGFTSTGDFTLLLKKKNVS